jgi:hypothetical protein
MTRGQFERYVAGAESLVRAYPGLHPHLISVAARLPGIHAMEVLKPMATLAAQHETETENADNE